MKCLLTKFEKCLAGGQGTPTQENGFLTHKTLEKGEIQMLSPVDEIKITAWECMEEFIFVLERRLLAMLEGDEEVLRARRETISRAFDEINFEIVNNEIDILETYRPASEI